MPESRDEKASQPGSKDDNEYVLLVAGDDIVQVGTRFGDPVVLGRATPQEKEIARSEYNRGLQDAIDICVYQAKLCHAEDGDVALEFVANNCLPKLRRGRS